MACFVHWVCIISQPEIKLSVLPNQKYFIKVLIFIADEAQFWIFLQQLVLLILDLRQA